MLIHRSILPCVLLFASFVNMQAQSWLKEDNGQYTIYYVQEYEQDVKFVRTWLDQAERLMLDKYDLQRHGYDISVYLPPAPTQYTNRGLATLLCCSQNTGEIHYMTPSAPAYGVGALGSLRLPADDYHAKTLIHEYITVGHTRVSADKPRGFRYYSAPSWFVQGLQEYDGTFHSTESNRTDGFEQLLDYADRRLQDTFHCCHTLAFDSETFGTTSAYFGGAFLMKFLADRFGEGIHVGLLKNEHPTFTEALTDELASRGSSVSEAFGDFQRWFALERGLEVGTPPTKVHTLYFAHSAAGGGWRTDLVLLNPYRSKTAEATIEVFGSNGMLRTEEQFSLPKLNVAEWELPTGTRVETGGVVVSSPAKLSGFLRFRHSDGAATSVQSAPVDDAFMVPVSNQVDRTGLAVYNADDKDLTVALTMGARSSYETIPAKGKVAKFVDEFFEDAGTGTLQVRTDPPGGRITVLALELINGNLVTLPAVPLNGSGF